MQPLRSSQSTAVVFSKIKYMQVYRSGHNEAVLKTVWVKAHGGSNPSACAIGKHPKGCFCFWRRRNERTPEFTGVRATSEKQKRFILCDLVGERGHFGEANLPLSAP